MLQTVTRLAYALEVYPNSLRRVKPFRPLVVGKFEFNTAETRKPAETQNRLSAKSFCGSASSPRLRGVKADLTTTELRRVVSQVGLRRFAEKERPLKCR